MTMRRILPAAAAALVTLAAAVPAEDRAAPKRSGYADAGPQTRAMQDDDEANPGFLWVARGAALWDEKAGRAGRSCRDCHGEAAASMRGVAARMPAWDEASGRVLNLEQRIDRCRGERQQAPPLAPEGDDRLGLAAYVGLQSRGMPMAVAVDGPARAAFERGRELFRTRFGQLDLSCGQCHDRRAGEKLAGNPIPQGHPNGYPLYRLEWQGMGSLARRLRNCLAGVRAEPFAPGSPDHLALELYLSWRAEGLPVETPAVRP